MRRVLLFGLVAVVLMVAVPAAAQWNLGLRFVGTGNYFPYLPGMQEEDGMPTMDTGLYGYKELMVGYRTDKLCYEASFAFDKFGSTFTDDEDVEWEGDLTWWYCGGSIFYTFLEGDGYSGSAGFRYQFGASALTESATYDARTTEELTFTATTSQFSVPFRFMWRPGGGKFAIGPEIAFKYMTASTELEASIERDSVTVDGPEYTGFDTEYSLVMKFVF